MPLFCTNWVLVACSTNVINTLLTVKNMYIRYWKATDLRILRMGVKLGSGTKLIKLFSYPDRAIYARHCMKSSQKQKESSG
uniref:Uncharacterized protein n=1 Tax=Pararge aegeria TaxID=116150 RepID=S4NVR0_9NEOP